MKKLRRKPAGWTLATPPRTEGERRTATAAGFVELPSGEWIMPERDFRPTLAAIQNYPYGRRCHACRTIFRSQKPRDPYCPSCHNIMGETLQQLEGILRPALGRSAEEQTNAWEKVEERLTCPDCGWQGNRNRMEPQGIATLLEYLPGWVERAHRHFMRHLFWNRFKYSRWFTPTQLSPEWKGFYYGSRDWTKRLEDQALSLAIEPLPQTKAK